MYAGKKKNSQRWSLISIASLAYLFKIRARGQGNYEQTYTTIGSEIYLQSSLNSAVTQTFVGER